MAAKISKPELCYMHTLLSLHNNPAQPMSVKKNTNVIERLLKSDFTDAWEITNDPSIPGKAAPSLPSVNPGDNKARRYYKYELPNTDETSLSSAPSICDITTANTDPYGYIAVDIDQTAVEVWKTTLAQFNEVAEGPSDWRAKMLRKKAYTLKLVANKAIITQLYSVISDYADGSSGLTAVKTLNLLSDKGDINPVEMAKVAKEYRDSHFGGEYIIVGGSQLAAYFDVAKYRLSPEGKMGAEFDLMDFPFVYDSSFDPIIQALASDTESHAIVIPIGALFVDTWNEYRGDKQLVDSNYMYTTIEIDGLLYDYAMAFNHCDGGYWQEMLKLHFGYGIIPEDAFASGNGLLRHYYVGCNAPGCL